jgi:hypothetical protein
MDFVSNQLYDGRKLRALTLVDVHTRESLAIWVDQGIRGDDVVRTVSAVVVSRGKLQRIQVDNVLKAIGDLQGGKSIRYRGAEAPRAQQRASTVSNCASRGPASRPTTRTSRRSMASCGRSV